MPGRLVVVSKDHSCGACPEIISAGSQAWEIPVRTTTPGQWGQDQWITVPVRYHPDCWKSREAGLGSDS